LVFQLVREAMFLDEASFRAWTWEKEDDGG